MRRAQGSAPVPNQVIKMVAERAIADPRTVRRVIDGLPVRGEVAERIAGELQRLDGMADLVPAQQLTRFVPARHVLRQRWERKRERRDLPGSPGRSLGRVPLTRYERAELESDEAELRAAGVSLQRPRTVAECPTGPCPWVGCRYHLYLDVDPETGFIKVRFPDRGVDELEETCALRVAANGPEAADFSNDPARTYNEIGRLTNYTERAVHYIAEAALRKAGDAARALDVEAAA